MWLRVASLVLHEKVVDGVEPLVHLARVEVGDGEDLLRTHARTHKPTHTHTHTHPPTHSVGAEGTGVLR